MTAPVWEFGPPHDTRVAARVSARKDDWILFIGFEGETDRWELIKMA
jgi:hypothetical protein